MDTSCYRMKQYKYVAQIVLYIHVIHDTHLRIAFHFSGVPGCNLRRLRAALDGIRFRFRRRRPRCSFASRSSSIELPPYLIEWCKFNFIPCTAATADWIDLSQTG